MEFRAGQQAIADGRPEVPQGTGTGCVIRVGVDLVGVDRISRLLADHPGDLSELFTSREIAYCGRKRHRDVHLAGRFAAKEAVLKAFGTGLGRGMRWTDVEVVNGPLGKPDIHLHGEVAARARREGLTGIDLSLSHSSNLAVAGVVTIWNGRNGSCGST